MNTHKHTQTHTHIHIHIHLAQWFEARRNFVNGNVLISLPKEDYFSCPKSAFFLFVREGPTLYRMLFNCQRDRQTLWADALSIKVNNCTAYCQRWALSVFFIFSVIKNNFFCMNKVTTKIQSWALSVFLNFSIKKWFLHFFSS